MTRFLLPLLLAGACLAGPVAGATPADGAASTRTVVLGADKWCPVNCAMEDSEPGYAVEIAREAFALAGWQFEYRLMPWERAVDAARGGRIDGVIGTLVANTPDFVYPRETIGRNVNVFYKRTGSAWRFRGMHTVETVVVGVANEYKFGEPFDAYVTRYHDDPKRLAIIFSQDPVQQGLDLLLAGRIDLYLDDRMVVNWALMHDGHAADVREAGELSQVPLYIAFSPARPDARAAAEAFDRGVRQLRASGRLAEILARYGVADWGPARLNKP